MISYKQYILTFLLFITLPQMGQAHTVTAAINPEQDTWITVFIHGILSIKPYITITNIMRFLNDTINDSVYAEVVKLMRNNPFFYQNQTIQARGLLPIDISKVQKGAAANLMGSLFEQISTINSMQRTNNFYYTFGWSGLLSRTARYNDAKHFFYQLEKEVGKFRAQGINPKIRLIGYSHGGTVILKLAWVKQQEQLTPSFTIDEVVMYGTPIQCHTSHLIEDPLFKKVYNIFSASDRAQKLDFFSPGEFFAASRFRSHGCFTLPPKLTQIELRVIRKKGESGPPSVCDRSDYSSLFSCSRNIRNVSPGHTELWFFGWTPLNYRHTFPFYPLPVAAFTPFFIHSLQKYEQFFQPEKPVILTIDPYRDAMMLSYHGCSTPVVLPFIGIPNLVCLQEKALRYKPDSAFFNWHHFNDYIGYACVYANRIVRARKCALKHTHTTAGK